jgi:uncharacterized membrane protein (DUF4010 family)
MFDLVAQSFNNMDVNINFFQKLALASLIGILIGIEREHRRPDGVELIAGIRSFTISCIAGMISSYVSLITSSGVLLISLAFFAIISALYIYIKNVVLRQPGITGAIALFCTFFLGVLITYDQYLVAIGGGVILTLLLVEKRPLHSFATTLTDTEILSAVRFLAVVFILYPIMPDQLFLEIINPRWILFTVIIVATISFISFVIMKQMGTGRGISLSGLLGGLVNSEATTGALAQLARKKKELIESCYVGIILSNATMLIRNLFIAFIVDPSGRVLLFMAPPQLVLTFAVSVHMIKSRNIALISETIQLESPFALSPAIKFGAGFATLSVVSKYASLWAGITGVYATALGGFISSAVVTASVSALAVSGYIPYSAAAITAVLASIISTGNKIILVKWSGPPELFELVKKTFIRCVIFGAFVLVIWGLVIHGYP